MFLNLLIVMAVLVMLGASLTLPGIAGLILTIGMAVDANVIVFERIREELNLGKTPMSAIRSGYDRAFITILDAKRGDIASTMQAYGSFAFEVLKAANTKATKPINLLETPP